MMKNHIFRSRFVAGALVAAFLLLITPIVPFAEDVVEPPQGGTLIGTLNSEGMRSTVSNAIVKIRNLNSGKEFVSLPTDAKGSFRINNIDEGWYTVGVTLPAGEYNLNYGIYIKAGETAKLSLEMLPGGMLEGKGGMASKKGFFKTPAGIFTIVAATGGAGYLIYELTKKEEEASAIR